MTEPAASIEGHAPRSTASLVWRRVLTVAWSSIVLGVAIEVLALAVSAGSKKSAGFAAIAVDTLRGVSWSLFVCVGIACGTVATKARPAVMGILGLLSAPLAFTISKSLHKSLSQALSITAAAQTGPSPIWIAAIKGVEYAVLGVALGRMGKRSATRLGAFVAIGAAAGAVFGGTILALLISSSEPALDTPAILTRAVNEILFPIGCSFVVYVAENLTKR